MIRESTKIAQPKMKMASGINGAPDPERRRLEESRNSAVPWRLWGPYLSERQWGTVREDYSPDGSAWDLPIGADGRT
jgi:hypothetical protein